MDHSAGASTTVHTIKHIAVQSNTRGFDILKRRQPIIETAHMSVDVFNLINTALVTLYEMEQRPTSNALMPVNYSFLFAEFSRLVRVSETNGEICEVLLELCKTLSGNQKQTDSKTGCPGRRLPTRRFKG